MLILNETKCAACGECVLYCPVEALIGWGIPEIDRDMCTECYACVEYCPTGALEVEE